MERAHSGFIGRAPGPLSPPTITQSILLRLNEPNSSNSGSMERKRTLRWRTSEAIDPRQAMLLVLDTHAPPDVTRLGSKAEFCWKQVAKAFRSLRQNLISVPIGGAHHPRDRHNVVIRNLLMKQVAH